MSVTNFDISAEAKLQKRAVLLRANPLSKLIAVLAATVPLVVTMDFVSAAVVLAGTLLLLPLSGVSPLLFFKRAWILVVASLLTVWGTALIAEDSGRTLLDMGIYSISEGSLSLGAATGIRAIGTAVPAVLVMASTDPTDLADALAQRAKLPARFVLGALAAMRLLGLLAEEWKTLGMARRARGVGSFGSPMERLRANTGQAFGQLVQAIRRASRLAMSMEAKGFGGKHRTWARESAFSWLDLWVILGGVALGALAVWAAVSAGTWHVVWMNH